MKKLIKLRDLSKEQWDKNRDSLCKLNKGESCENCIFQWVGGCSDSIYRSSWINHKDFYSDKFLDQEVEIDAPDILDEVEKKYLSNIIKPFRDRVIYIKKVKSYYNDAYFISINISSKYIPEGEIICFPFFNNKMYEEMEDGKEYTLEELGL